MKKKNLILIICAIAIAFFAIWTIIRLPINAGRAEVIAANFVGKIFTGEESSDMELDNIHTEKYTFKENNKLTRYFYSYMEGSGEYDGTQEYDYEVKVGFFGRITLSTTRETFRVWVDADDIPVRLEIDGMSGKISLEESFSQKQPTKGETDADMCIECGNKAEYTFNNPFSGEEESYCYRHYQEIVDILGEMEEDVGQSGLTHTCEECSRAGTYEIIGFSGETEYYCYSHYKEMTDLIDYMLNS